MLAVSIALIAGVVVCGGPWGVDSQLVRTSLEEQCYNVGSCTPLEEPKGDQKEICRIFEESLTCMQRATEACQQLGFPPDTVHLATDGLHLLREELHSHCNEDLMGNPSPLPQQDATAAPEEDGGGHGQAQPFNIDVEDTGRSEPVQAQINSGPRLPWPLSALLVISLLLTGAWHALL